MGLTPGVRLNSAKNNKTELHLGQSISLHAYLVRECDVGSGLSRYEPYAVAFTNGLHIRATGRVDRIA